MVTAHIPTTRQHRTGIISIARQHRPWPAINWPVVSSMDNRLTGPTQHSTYWNVIQVTALCEWPEVKVRWYNIIKVQWLLPWLQVCVVCSTPTPKLMRWTSLNFNFNALYYTEWTRLYTRWLFVSQEATSQWQEFYNTINIVHFVTWHLLV